MAAYQQAMNTRYRVKETSQGITREKRTKECLAQKKEPKTPAPSVIQLKVRPGGIGLEAPRAWGKKVDLQAGGILAKREKVTTAEGQSIPYHDPQHHRFTKELRNYYHDLRKT